MRLAIAGLAAAALVVTLAARQGLYSTEQATRGKARYTVSCASCHMDDLSGSLSGDTGAPPLRGDAFIAYAERADVKALFEYIKATMPADDPSTLTDAAYVDILAFLFQANGYAAGDALHVDELGTVHIPKR